MKNIDLIFWSDNFNQEFTNYSLIQSYVLDQEAIKKHYYEQERMTVDLSDTPYFHSAEERERMGVQAFIREFNIALSRYKRHLIVTFVSYFDLMLSSVFESLFLLKPKLLIEHLNQENISIKELVKMIVDSSKNSDLLSDVCTKASQRLNTGPIDQRIIKLEKFFKFKFDKITVSNLSYLYRLRNYLVHEKIECEISEDLLEVIYSTLDFLVVQTYQALASNNYEFDSNQKEYFEETIKEAEPPFDIKLVESKISF